MTSEPTLAEDLLLILFQPSSSTIAGEGTNYYVLAGAIVAELAQRGDIATGQDGKVVVTDPSNRPSDELLARAWDYIAEKPRGVQTVLAAIGPSLREPVLARLLERGDLAQEPHRALGLFKTTRLREGTSERRVRLVENVRKVLLHDTYDDGDHTSPRARALAALVASSGVLVQLHNDIPWSSAVAKRARELQESDWGAQAAGQAVDRTAIAVAINSAVVGLATRPPN